MGWLLLSKNKNKRKPECKKNSSKYAPETPSWNPGRMAIAVKVLGAVVAVAIAISGWNLSYKLLSRYIQRTHSESVSVSKVVLLNAPQWMGAGTQNKIRQTVAAHIAPDPLNGHSLRQAATALADIPWIKQVTQI